MKVLADENFPKAAVERLAQNGFDALWARAAMAGASDETILKRAGDEHRLLLTFDKDFGELAFHWNLPAACGIVLFRFAARSPEYVAERVCRVLLGRADWAGNFAVVEEHRVRVRPLPPVS